MAIGLSTITGINSLITLRGYYAIVQVTQPIQQLIPETEFRRNTILVRNSHSYAVKIPRTSVNHKSLFYRTSMVQQLNVYCRKGKVTISSLVIQITYSNAVN